MKTRLGRSCGLALAVSVVIACKSDPIADLKAGKVEAVEKALARGKLQAAGADATGKPLLVLAWEADQPAMGKLLLDRGADPNLLRANGQPFIHEVLASGKPAWIDAFHSSHLLDVHATDPDGVTPLMVAVKRGNGEAARWLLARGADAFAVTRRGDGVADVEKDEKPPSPVGIAKLVDELSCWWRPSKEELSKALAAAKANDVAGLKAHLAENKCPALSVGAPDAQGQTLLMAAVAAGSAEAAHLLLDRGADLHASRFTDARFVTALDLARDPAMQAVLRAHGARPAPERKAEVIIAAGAKTAGELDATLAEWSERAQPLAPGFPQVFSSDRLPGLNPGWQILVLGICDEGVGRTWAAAFRSIQKDVYVRTVTVKAERLACPATGRQRNLLQPEIAETPEGIMVARYLERTISVELRSKGGELVDWKYMDVPGADEAHPMPCDGLDVHAEGPYIEAAYTCYTPYCTTPSATDMSTIFRVEKGKIRSREHEGDRRQGECDQ